MTQMLCKKFATAVICDGKCGNVHCFLPEGYMLIPIVEYNKMKDESVNLRIKVEVLEAEARMSRRGSPTISEENAPSNKHSAPDSPVMKPEGKANPVEALKKFGATEFPANGLGSTSSMIYPIPSHQYLSTASEEGKQSKDSSVGAKPYKYKTRQCAFFAEGRCTKGDKCTFIHGPLGRF